MLLPDLASQKIGFLRLGVGSEFAQVDDAVESAKGRRRYGTLISLVALLTAFSVARANVFPTVDNLLNVLNQISILGTMALGRERG